MIEQESLSHLTVNTGHSRISHRSEISRLAIAAMQDDIRIAVSQPKRQIAIGGGVASGCTMTAAASGPALIATAWHEDAPLVTMGVLADGSDHHLRSTLWSLLTKDVSTPAGMEITQPSIPWIAVKFEIGLELHIDDAKWLGDWERCVGWAWIDLWRNARKDA